MKNLLIIYGLIMIFGCSRTTKQDEIKEVKLLFRCMISPVGINSSTYLIEVFDDRKYKVSFGEVYSYDISAKFKKIVKSNEINIDSSTFSRLLNIQKQISLFNSLDKTEVRKGGWEIKLETSDKHFNFYYGENTGSSFGILVNELILLSPIKIDLHSWS